MSNSNVRQQLKYKPKHAKEWLTTYLKKQNIFVCRSRKFVDWVRHNSLLEIKTIKIVR